MDNTVAHIFIHFAFLLSLLFVHGVTSDSQKDEMCEKGHMAACAPPKTFPLNIPETEEELGELCRFWPGYMACVRNFVLTCTGSFDSEDQYQKVYTTLLAVCGEDTVLHEGLVKNLVCIKKVAKQLNTSCFEERAKISEAYDAIDKQVEDWESVDCLVHAFNVGCFLKKAASECGTQAEKVSKEVVVRSEYNLEACPGDVKQRAEQLLERLGLDVNQKQSIKDVIRMSEKI